MGCIYCDGKHNDNIIVGPKVSLGIAGSVEAAVFIEFNTNKLACDISPYPYSDSGKVYQKKVKIKYCPMCGRKL